MPPSTSTDPWIVYRQPRENARLRLLCLHYAGGSARIFRPWTASMPKDIDVLPVQLPGRERRMRQVPFTRMDPVIEALTPAVLPYLDRAFAIFGHSMGASIGYELAQRLRHSHGLTPVLLAVSARQAPSRPQSRDEAYKQPDPEFVEHLREMGGTPDAVLANAELMELMLPLIRADFELINTYEPAPQPPLPCPVTAFGGVSDPEISRQDLEAWSEITGGRFQLQMFSGDHFFLDTHHEELIDALVRDLRA